MAEKRADCFAAGTDVVWDADLHRGEHADAEPAVPGWAMPVDELFQ
jgi:hypothetical protein